MKKMYLNFRMITLILTMMTVISASNVFAQTTSASPEFARHEISVGFGLWSSNDLINVYSDLTGTALSGGTYSVSNEKMSGNYALSYRYALRKRLWLGASVVYSQLQTDVNSVGEKIGTSENNYFTLAPEIAFRYVNTKIFKIYGFIGAGLTLNSQTTTTDGEPSTENTPYFNFQLSPVCVQLGNHVGMYLEAGFGYKGILCLGLFAKF